MNRKKRIPGPAEGKASGRRGQSFGSSWGREGLGWAGLWEPDETRTQEDVAQTVREQASWGSCEPAGFLILQHECVCELEQVTSPLGTWAFSPGEMGIAIPILPRL